jgi:hypothetical protein
MPIIECPCCGSALALPEAVREGGAFACAACFQQLRNTQATRDFRWESVDPYIRKHGASKANIWGGLLGAMAWLPGLAIFLLLRGRFAIGAFLLIAAPYLLLLALLRAARARRPAMLWLMQLWTGLGLFLLYLAGLLTLLAGGEAALLSDFDVAPALPASVGGIWLATGLGGTWWYKRTSTRLPQARPAPAVSTTGAAAPGAVAPAGGSRAAGQP